MAGGHSSAWRTTGWALQTGHGIDFQDAEVNGKTRKFLAPCARSSAGVSSSGVAQPGVFAYEGVADVVNKAIKRLLSGHKAWGEGLLVSVQK